METVRQKVKEIMFINTPTKLRDLLRKYSISMLLLFSPHFLLNLAWLNKKKTGKTLQRASQRERERALEQRYLGPGISVRSACSPPPLVNPLLAVSQSPVSGV